MRGRMNEVWEDVGGEYEQCEQDKDGGVQGAMKAGD